MSGPLYRTIAAFFSRQIHEGLLRPGERLPSVRALSRQHRVSVSTVVQAYVLLERTGLVQARPRSGFVVRDPADARLPEPVRTKGTGTPVDVDIGATVAEILASGEQRRAPFGAATMEPARLPFKALNRCLRRAAREIPMHGCHYGATRGLDLLRRQIARHALSFGCAFPPDDIVITIGAMEALNLSLRAVARPGDVVAVESPSYFGILQAIESLGVRVVEIPTDVRTGPDLAFLERALRRHPMKAFLTMPTCHNPLGYVLSDGVKKEIVDIAGRHEMAIVEDDVFGDLAFAESRPRPLKAFDRDGLVMTCSSFSKTIAPGLRLGWVQAGRFAATVERLKSVNTLATPELVQLAVARFLEGGSYFRQVRRVRWWLEAQVRAYSSVIADAFPVGTRITRPAGGYVLWLQLPKRCDGDRLHARAADRQISIVPGSVFSSSGQHKHCIRLNCGHAFGPAHARAIRTLGRLVADDR